MFKDVQPDLDYLSSRGLLKNVSVSSLGSEGKASLAESLGLALAAAIQLSNIAQTEDPEFNRQLELVVNSGVNVRLLSVQLECQLKMPIVSICNLQLPGARPRTPAENIAPDTLRIGLRGLPVPDQSCSWQDILDFKAEMHDKLWAFRRFLHTLSTKKQTEAELRDDIEWSLNEYAKAMKLHNLKAGNSFMEVYVIPGLEVLEDIATFNWSKIARGALSVKKRQIELMEAEMKAPGRECAYVFDAHKRFGTTS